MVQVAEGLQRSVTHRPRDLVVARLSLGLVIPVGVLPAGGLHGRRHHAAHHLHHKAVDEHGQDVEQLLRVGLARRGGQAPSATAGGYNGVGEVRQLRQSALAMLRVQILWGFKSDDSREDQSGCLTVGD